MIMLVNWLRKAFPRHINTRDYRARSLWLGGAMKLCAQPMIPRGTGDGRTHCLWSLNLLCVHSEEEMGEPGLCLLCQSGNLKHSNPSFSKSFL